MSETQEEAIARRQKWEVKVYKDFNTADKDRKTFYRSLTPQQRIEILLELIAIDGPEPRLDRTPRITKLKID